MPRVTSRSWKPEEIDRLRDLAAKGATLLRACAAIGRPTGTVKRKASDLGLSFAGARQVRASLRATGAIESNQKQSHRILVPMLVRPNSAIAQK